MNPLHAGEHAPGDGRRSSRRVVPERSFSMHARFGSQTTGPTPAGVSFGRSASLDRVSDFIFRRRRSLSHSLDGSNRLFEGAPSDVLAQVGDSWDRVLDNVEDGVAGDVNVRIEDYALALSTLPPLTTETRSSLPPDAVLFSTEKKIDAFSSPFKQYKLPQLLDNIAYLIYLALFGIFGIFARYLLQKLFGPGCLALPSYEPLLYIDLPANMAGSFLMGWFGLVFKGDVRHVSEHLAVGISTGFMGSLTTFSGWNQKMLELSSHSKGRWVSSVAGFILGYVLVNVSFWCGAASAEWVRQRLVRKFGGSLERPTFFPDHWRVQRRSQHLTVATALLLILGLLWGVSGALARPRLDRATEGALLWLACLVGPPGVWLRWYLARLNGRGLGKRGSLRWLPLGTLAANILAAVVMAALSTVNKAVKTKRCAVITQGVQLGFLGCLSTVSTFAAEIYAMKQSGHDGKAFGYAALTFVPSFALGTLIYSVPVWTRHYE